MKFYKIQHIPTGLFFKPSRYGSKANLSKKGKVYERKPNVEQYLGKLYHHPVTKAEWNEKYPLAPNAPIWSRPYYQGFEGRAVVLSEWEVVEYTAFL